VALTDFCRGLVRIKIQENETYFKSVNNNNNHNNDNNDNNNNNNNNDNDNNNNNDINHNIQITLSVLINKNLNKITQKISPVDSDWFKKLLLNHLLIPELFIDNGSNYMSSNDNYDGDDNGGGGGDNKNDNNDNDNNDSSNDKNDNNYDDSKVRQDLDRDKNPVVRSIDAQINDRIDMRIDSDLQGIYGKNDIDIDIDIGIDRKIDTSIGKNNDTSTGTFISIINIFK
jgi:hypothetical protein